MTVLVLMPLPLLNPSLCPCPPYPWPGCQVDDSCRDSVTLAFTDPLAAVEWASACLTSLLHHDW